MLSYTCDSVMREQVPVATSGVRRPVVVVPSVWGRCISSAGSCRKPVPLAAILSASVAPSIAAEISAALVGNADRPSANT